MRGAPAGRFDAAQRRDLHRARARRGRAIADLSIGVEPPGPNIAVGLEIKIMIGSGGHASRSKIIAGWDDPNPIQNVKSQCAVIATGGSHPDINGPGHRDGLTADQGPRFAIGRLIPGKETPQAHELDPIGRRNMRSGRRCNRRSRTPSRRKADSVRGIEQDRRFRRPRRQVLAHDHAGRSRAGAEAVDLGDGHPVAAQRLIGIVETIRCAGKAAPTAVKRP